MGSKNTFHISWNQNQTGSQKLSFVWIFFFLSNATTCPCDFVFLPPGHGRSVTDFWGWEAHEAQLRCPEDVSGDIGGCSARRTLKPKFCQPTQTMVTERILPFRENSHGSAGNRIRDLMSSSQRLWPLDHEAGPYGNVMFCNISALWMSLKFGHQQVTDKSTGPNWHYEFMTCLNIGVVPTFMLDKLELKQTKILVRPAVDISLWHPRSSCLINCVQSSDSNATPTDLKLIKIQFNSTYFSGSDSTAHWPAPMTHQAHRRNHKTSRQQHNQWTRSNNN